jgi:hypothetical protein
MGQMRAANMVFSPVPKYNAAKDRLKIMPQFNTNANRCLGKSYQGSEAVYFRGHSNVSSAPEAT